MADSNPAPAPDPRADIVYSIDEVPPVGESIALGFQHYLTMFGATVAIPLILAGPLGLEDKVELGMLIGTMFLVSGIATLLQTTLGNRLPIVQGGSFAFLGPAFAICGMAELSDAGWQVRMQHLQGAIIIGALAEIGFGYLGLVGRLVRFISPIVIAPTVALIGLSLFEIGAPSAGKNWWIGGLTIALIILFSQYLGRRHRFLSLFPIMLAILLAWAVAGLGTAVGWFDAGDPAIVDLAPVATAPWFRVPYPLQWGWPVFGVAAAVGMLAGYLASMVESIGDYYACARLSGAPLPTRKLVDRGIGMEGIGCLLAGLFGTGNGSTSYSENIGAIGLTGVGSRRVIQVGALLMIGLALVGKFGAVFSTIPEPIVGGMYCAMFGMIVAVGLSNLQHVDLNAARNLFIIGFAFFMGLSLPAYFKANPLSFEPAWVANLLNTVGSTGMAVGAIVATFLDNTIPGTRKQRGLEAWHG